MTDAQFARQYTPMACGVIGHAVKTFQYRCFRSQGVRDEGELRSHPRASPPWAQCSQCALLWPSISGPVHVPP